MGRSASKNPLCIGLKHFISLVFNRIGDRPQQYKALLRTVDERTTEIEPGSGVCLTEDSTGMLECARSGTVMPFDQLLQGMEPTSASSGTVMPFDQLLLSRD